VSGAATLAAADIMPLASVAGLAGGGPAAPAQIEIGLGRKDDRLQVTAKGRVAGTDIEADLSGASLADIGGNLRLGRLSLPWLSSAFALSTAPPAPGSVWASARFGPAPAPTLAGRVAIKAATLDLGAGLAGTDAACDLAVSEDGLRLRNMDLAFAGGRLGGEFAIARQGGLASLTGQGQARDVDLVQLLGAAAFEGRISGDLRFGGSGESVAAIVGNLGGAGNVAFTALQVAQADAGAVTRAATRALRSDDPLASARLQETTAQELGRGALNLGAISAPATLVAGVLRVGPVRTDTEAASWQGTLNLDIRSLTLDARGMLQAKAAPRGWSGDAPAVVLGWQGPISRPTRILDVAPLTNGLASVVLARELDRIDTFEADQNERQRRNGQQQMEADRRAAAEAARRAREEAARRAREEAARAAAAAERARAEREQAERAARFERSDPAAGPAPITTFPQPARPGLPPGG
jgi:AsmA-like C-terminal region